MKGFDPNQKTNKVQQKLTSEDMLKRTYAIGLLAAATLGCFAPKPITSQVEVNKQTASHKMAQLLVLAMLFSRPLKSIQNQLDYQVLQDTTIQIFTQLQISNQDAKQMAAVELAMPFSKTLKQHSEAIRLLITNFQKIQPVLSVS